jgi:hypothetical protein
MTKPLPWSGRIALPLLLPAALLPLLFAGPRSSAPVRPAQFHASRFHDWTTHHAVYSRTGTLAALEAARSDPRAVFRWREIEQQSQVAQIEARQRELQSFLQFRFPRRPGRFPIRSASNIHADWNISLGGGSTAAGQFPAKFTFDTTAAANCANDFIVFPVNVNGGAAQPNIVAFNNLYSGTAGGNGICNRAVTANDTGVAATVLWSYNVHALAAAAVPTSPVLSLDGTKVAFVESAAGNPAHFHVLAWKSGDGKVANVQSVLTPKAIIAPFSATAPAAGSGTATDLAFGATTDTLSSPYIDYAQDTAYVGNDAGVLFRFKNVFCTTAGCGNAAPSLDTTWGGTGSVNVPCAAKLTGPVQDFYTLNIFVGCADGKVYGFTSTGAALATPSIAVGNGTAIGGVVESPIVDGLNGFIYAVSGTGAAPNTTHAVLVQAKTSLAGPCAGGTLCVATFGVSGVFPMHAPAFNDPYFSSATPATWLIYQTAYSSAANLTLYAATFSATRTLTPGAAANVFNFGTHLGEYAPLTEFNNAGTDRLFFGVLHSSATALNLGAFPINTFPAAIPPGAGVGNGPSGMVIDNSSASVQASSIYFSVQGTNVAMKLTQAGLQ